VAAPPVISQPSIPMSQLPNTRATESSEMIRARVIVERGMFRSLYPDRASHFVYTPKAGGAPGRGVQTQIVRALKQTGSELIAAMSPEARGCCELVFGAWHRRLPQELRLRNITTVEGASACQSGLPKNTTQKSPSLREFELQRPC